MNYEKPNMEVIVLSEEDVITTSTGDEIIDTETWGELM